jgi:hypothetical protein
MPTLPTPTTCRTAIGFGIPDGSVTSPGQWRPGDVTPESLAAGAAARLTQWVRLASRTAGVAGRAKGDDDAASSLGELPSA